MTASLPEFEVTLAATFIPEQEYILDVLLCEFLGLRYHTRRGSDGDTVVIALDNRSVRLPQRLFRGEDRASLAEGYPPPMVHPLDVNEAGLPPASFGGRTVPVLYGDVGPDGGWITNTEEHLTLHADVLGSSFFLLTCLEEIGATERDEFDLFPPHASLASTHGFLSRPIVNEYVEILWRALLVQWPGLRRRSPAFRVRVSHDVDRPLAYDHVRIRDRLWSVRQDIRSRKLPPLYGSRLLNAVAASLGLPHNDPFDNFDWLMDTDEHHGYRATYYFLCGGTSRFDGRYDITSREMRSLLRRLVERGHEIGLHGSYETLDQPDRLAAERARLAETLREEGLPAEVGSVRQHYLRWRAPTTWRVAEQAGLSQDSSVGFNQAIGFRSGTSFEYPVFDVEHRRRLRLRERPLHLMDRALAGLDEDRAIAAIDDLHREAARNGGSLEVLWHNNIFVESSRELGRYERAITSGCNGERTG